MWRSIRSSPRRRQPNLPTAQPLLAGLVASGKVKVTGGVYDIATANVSMV